MDPLLTLIWSFDDFLASPHTRGWTLQLGGRQSMPTRLPRTRGDGPRGRATSPHRGYTGRRGCRLPRTRGDGPWERTGWHGLASGFPAHAGMDPRRESGGRGGRRLPRTRGDGPPETRSTRASRTRGQCEHVMASPHTRGWTVGDALARAANSGFPAHAGMDPLGITFGTIQDARLPRTRGDGPCTKTVYEARGPEGLPRTRGDGPG